jgi:hypothetical protein
MPRRKASSIPRSTPGDSPKSSAVTTSRFGLAGSRHSCIGFLTGFRDWRSHANRPVANHEAGPPSHLFEDSRNVFTRNADKDEENSEEK